MLKCRVPRAYFAIITLGLSTFTLSATMEAQTGIPMAFSKYPCTVARIALCSWLVHVMTTGLFAQMPAACKGPAELEKVLVTHPSAGAYDALGAYFGQRQQLSCATAAFEAAVRQDPNSWGHASILLWRFCKNTKPRGQLVNSE